MYKQEWFDSVSFKRFPHESSKRRGCTPVKYTITAHDACLIWLEHHWGVFPEPHISQFPVLSPLLWSCVTLFALTELYISLKSEYTVQGSHLKLHRLALFKLMKDTFLMK